MNASGDATALDEELKQDLIFFGCIEGK